MSYALRKSCTKDLRMDHKLKSSLNELRELAKSSGAGSDASVELSENKIYDYFFDLREAVRSEKAKPGASEFWATDLGPQHGHAHQGSGIRG